MNKETFSRTLTKMIRDSGAYRNGFFERAKACIAIPAAKLKILCRSWYEITESFGLSLTLYDSVTAGMIRDECDLKRRQELEQIMLLASKISANDLGMGLSNLGNPDGTCGIHYNLFADMVKPIVQRSELENPANYALIPEAKIIADHFWEMFKTVVGGAAALRVVEEIAFNIVDAMLPLFLAAEENRKKIFTKNDLLYVTLHLEIEQQHAEQSEGIAVLVGGEQPSMQNDILREVEILSSMFAAFWRAMEHETFD